MGSLMSFRCSICRKTCRHIGNISDTLCHRAAYRKKYTRKVFTCFFHFHSFITDHSMHSPRTKSAKMNVANYLEYLETESQFSTNSDGVSELRWFEKVMGDLKNGTVVSKQNDSLVTSTTPGWTIFRVFARSLSCGLEYILCERNIAVRLRLIQVRIKDGIFGGRLSIWEARTSSIYLFHQLGDILVKKGAAWCICTPVVWTLIELVMWYNSWL